MSEFRELKSQVDRGLKKGHTSFGLNNQLS